MKTILPLTSIRIPPSGMHLIVKAKINGKSARLVLDTGASQTVLDFSRMERFTDQKKFTRQDGHSSGIGSSSLESHLFNAETIMIGKLEIYNAPLVLLDMVHVNKSYELIRKKPVDGVLGGDILKQFNAVIDYGKKTLVLSDKKKKKR